MSKMFLPDFYALYLFLIISKIETVYLVFSVGRKNSKQTYGVFFP